PVSEKLYVKHSGRALHYSFDYRQAHFVVLDNSRSDALPADELKFLETDLAEHERQPIKFVVSHRPSWILDAMMGNPQFPLHQLARKYGVQYIIAGHVHAMIHGTLQGVTYISMPSAGGHLRLAKDYEGGWFFGYATVEVN